MPLANKAKIFFRPYMDPPEMPDEDYPFWLCTGRVLEHWHTGTMTMKAEELRRAYPECFMEINPRDAAKLGVRTGDQVRIVSRRGQATIRARVVDIPNALLR